MKTQGQSNSLLTYLLVACFFSSPAWGWTQELCGRFILEGKDSVSFSRNEEILICGSKEVREWSGLSETQSLFSLRTFLEQRGYYGVTTAKDGGKTRVRLNERTLVKAWQLQDEGRLEASRFRQIQGEVLNSALLDSVADRVKLSLENEAYACPSVKASAQAPEANLKIAVAPVTKKTLRSIRREPVEGMDVEALSRFDAFTIRGPFSRNNLLVTENRVSSEGILQNSHFEVLCDSEFVDLRQRSVAGPPRLLVFGVGINTEKGPSAKATWKHLRLGKNASHVSVSLMGSFKDQKFDVLSDLYFSAPFHRLHLNPALTVIHENENAFERYRGQLRLTPATSWDGDEWGIKSYLGPTVNMERTVSGGGPQSTEFMAFAGFLQVMQHDYELFQNSPRTGFEFNVNVLSAFRNAFSPFEATKLELHGTKMWNLFGWEPPAVVLGIRANLSTTVTEEPLGPGSRLPSTYRFFLGGSRDLRGFSRLSLPGPEGALTAASLSGEARFLALLPWNLQPIAFVDFGKLGSSAFQWDDVTYWSPGAGLRWESPIGSFRGTVAKGFTSRLGQDVKSEWNIYVSFGEEF